MGKDQLKFPSAHDTAENKSVAIIACTTLLDKPCMALPPSIQALSCKIAFC